MLIDQKRKSFENNKELWDKFIDLTHKVNQDHPDKSDVKEYQKILDKHKGIWALCHGFAKVLQENFIEAACGTVATKAVIKKEVEAMKEDLQPENALEDIVVDQIVTNWLRANYSDMVMNVLIKNQETASNRLSVDKLLENSQKRLLRSIETYAKVRKWRKQISLQVNIATDGGKQVNVA